MRWHIVVLLLLALLVATGQPMIAHGEPMDAPAPNPEALESAVWAYEEALEAGNIKHLLSFFAEDAYALPPGGDAVIGKEAIAEYMGGFFDEKVLDRNFKLVDYTVSGNYATRLGEWINTFTSMDGSTPVLEVGRCMFGYELDGMEWKIAWQIWNYANDAPPALSHDGSPC
jgi:ketosteroid isomerase-like protein